MIDAKKIQSDELSVEEARRRGEDMASYLGPDNEMRSELAHPVPMCPTCGTQKRDLLFKKGAFRYYQCADCELAYIDPRLNDAALGYLYSEGRGRFATEFIYIPTADIRKQTIYRRKLSDVERLGSGRRLLDYGSSAGYFVQLAIENGWQAHGIEINPFCVQWAREKLGLENIHEGDVGDCGFEPGQFDIITMWDVLEHIPDPFSVIQQMQPLLAPDGKLIIETSHFDCFETDFLKSDNTNLTPDFHLMHFTRKSFEALAQRAGMRVVEQVSFGLDIAHILRFFRVEKGISADIPNDLVSAIQHEIDTAGRGCYIRAVLARL